MTAPGAVSLPGPGGLDEAMIRRVVTGFYDQVRRDPLIGPVFTGAIAVDAWDAHLDRMCAFWSSMLLQSGRYEGRPLRPHLLLDGIGDAHFERWLALFGETVEAVCPPPIAALFRDRALRVARSFRLSIAFHRGEDPATVARFAA